MAAWGHLGSLPWRPGQCTWLRQNPAPFEDVLFIVKGFWHGQSPTGNFPSSRPREGTPGRGWRGRAGVGLRAGLCGDSGLQPAAGFRLSLTFCKLVTYESGTREASSGFLQLQARGVPSFQLGFLAQTSHNQSVTYCVHPQSDPKGRAFAISPFYR